MKNDNPSIAITYSELKGYLTRLREVYILAAIGRLTDAFGKDDLLYQEIENKFGLPEVIEKNRKRIPQDKSTYKCDEEVYEKGTPVWWHGNISQIDMDSLLHALKPFFKDGVDVDWHYAAGRNVVKVLTRKDE